MKIYVVRIVRLGSPAEVRIEADYFKLEDRRTLFLYKDLSGAKKKAVAAFNEDAWDYIYEAYEDDI